MRPSLSIRIGEAPRQKDRLAIPFDRIATLAAAAGFCGLSIRPSAVHLDSPPGVGDAVAAALRARGLDASMVTGSLALVTNDAAAPEVFGRIAAHLELAGRLGARMVRVMVHGDGDIAPARRAADEAAEHGIALVHQCHWGSCCETVDDCLELVREVGRPNFGITYEPANLLACGDAPDADGVRRLAPHIFNVYFQNVRIDPESPLAFATRRRGPVGVRFVPLDDPRGIEASVIADALRAEGYGGWWTLHQPLLEGQRVEDAVTAAGAFVAGLGIGGSTPG